MTFRKDTHIEEQEATLKKLMDAGYKAVFGCGFIQCKQIIDQYFLKVGGVK